MNKSIEERKQNARNMNELLDHLIKIMEQNDERFALRYGRGGELISAVIHDKQKDIEYVLHAEPIKYDEDGIVVNL